MSSRKRETRDLQAATKQSGDEETPGMTWPLWRRTTVHDLVGLVNGRIATVKVIFMLATLVASGSPPT
jgi:hypothetical protein